MQREKWRGKRRQEGVDSVGQMEIEVYDVELARIGFERG